MLLAGLLCLVLGSLTSYIRARAEAAGLTATVGHRRAGRTIDHRAGRHRAHRRASASAVRPGDRVVVARRGVDDHRVPTSGHRLAAVPGPGRRDRKAKRRVTNVRAEFARLRERAVDARLRGRLGDGQGASATVVGARPFGRAPTRRRSATGRRARQLRKNLRRVVGPARPSCDGPAGRRRAAVVLPLLARDVPPAQYGQSRRGGFRRAKHDRGRTYRRRARGRAAARRRAAAHGQLGRRRAVAGRAFQAGRSRPSPNGSSRSRCSTGSSRTARASAWRCCR